MLSKYIKTRFYSYAQFFMRDVIYAKFQIPPNFRINNAVASLIIYKAYSFFQASFNNQKLFEKPVKMYVVFGV